MTTRTAKSQLGRTRKAGRKDVSSMKNALQAASESLSKGARGFIAWLEKGMPAVRDGLGAFGKYAKDSATAIDKELKGGWASIKERLTGPEGARTGSKDRCEEDRQEACGGP